MYVSDFGSHNKGVSFDKSILYRSYFSNMGKDKNTPKGKTPRHEAKHNDSFVDITAEGAASPQVRTRTEFQEAFDELKANCTQWAKAQSVLWEQQMLEHRNSIVDSINQAIEEKIQPKITNIDKFVIELEETVKNHKSECSKASQDILVVKDLQKNMSRTIEGFAKRFDRFALTDKEHMETLGTLSQKIDITDQHLTCFKSRMDVLHESLDEHEKLWVNWESGDKRITPCYRDLEHKKQHRRKVIDETEDESPMKPTERLYGGGPMQDGPVGAREEGATALDPRGEGARKKEERYKLNLNGTRPKSFSSGGRQSFRLFEQADEENDSYYNQAEDRPNSNPEPASETHAQPNQPGPPNKGRISPNPQFSRPPPFTTQQRLMLDKSNLLDEINSLYARFEHTPIDTEKKKLKNLFYDRYEELSKALEELRIISDDPDHRYQLRKDRDNANAFKNAFGPLDTQRKQKHRIDPPEFDGDILKYHGWKNQWETYDSDSMYTVEEKFQMLTKSLKGEAAEATRSIAFSQANYKQILEILKNRFGSESQAINKRKHLLRDAAAAEVPEDYSSEQLTIKYNHIQNQILSLR